MPLQLCKALCPQAPPFSLLSVVHISLKLESGPPGVAIFDTFSVKSSAGPKRKAERSPRPGPASQPCDPLVTDKGLSGQTDRPGERMSGSAVSGGSPCSAVPMEMPSDLFKELWARLKECHDVEVQGLQVKISKLKKERCLDAQRLEEFYSRNQQLREHQKALHDNVKVLEDRLRAGLCDRCAVTEEHMRKKQVEFESVRQQNLRLITELMNERNALQDDNKKLSQELEQLRLSGSRTPPARSPHPEEGVIPDSPVQELSLLSVVSKMRRKKEHKHVRYAEKSSSRDDPRMGIPSLNSCGLGNGVLVAETCEMEVSQITKCCTERWGGTGVVAETCPMEEASQSVLGSLSTPGAPQGSQEGGALAQNGTSPRQPSTSPDFSKDKEWPLQQRTSPVFGRSVKPFKHLEATENGPPSNLPNIKVGCRERLCTEDIPQIAPLKTCAFRGQPSVSGERAQLGVGRGEEQTSEEGGVAVDTPLDLSDRVPGGRRARRESGPPCEQQPLPERAQNRSSLAMLTAHNGDCSPSTDSLEDPYLTEDQHQHPAVLPSTLPHGKTITQHIFHIQVPDVHEPRRKKIRVVSKGCEQMSVLQLNPCARVKRSPSQDEDGDPAITDEQPWTDRSPLPELGVQRPEGETVDTDCTFISHSVLLMGPRESGPSIGREVWRNHPVPPTISLTFMAVYIEYSCIGQKANDSLAEIFDRSVYGEYESCPQDDEQDVHPHEEDQSLDMSGEKAQTPPNQAVVKQQASHNRRANASFAHVEVVRKKEERKKLKAHTCKECEVYYGDLPEAERQKKLLACSRHRARYIPPSTPDHFWEVGFPSTQTCVDRGYIKEDDEPDPRMRRRRPYNAIFSPKGKEQKT
ncbi:hypothetical protein AAFF_G00245550 [Aldrovandia affinis]|uniref:DNA endonuclease RBBP8 n=1 Tax=Aldrovandia affinis TaxID=143900 RepID=A0AAD7W2W2_9TELE|nr:hypothetical protein AAFF_G00245550 [Aldrovandia affinis]